MGWERIVLSCVLAKKNRTLIKNSKIRHRQDTTKPIQLIFVSLLLLLVSVSALRVAPLPRHTRGVRRRLPAMEYHKVKAPTADEARAKNPTRNERPGLASKYEGGLPPPPPRHLVWRHGL